MSRITTVINQKGGIGKTTTAHALATGLLYKGHNTLIIDLDPQSNLTFTMGADNQQSNIFDVLQGEANPLESIQHTEQGDIITGSPLLVHADTEFNKKGREYILKNALKPLDGKYSYIIIDTPPALGTITINALTASNDIIIPMGADIYSLQGLADLNVTINMVRKHCNPSLSINGLLITRYNGRAILNKDLKEIIEDKASQIGGKMYKNVIREAVVVREAQTQQTSLFNYSIKSKPAQDYLGFIEEYLESKCL